MIFNLENIILSSEIFDDIKKQYEYNKKPIKIREIIVNYSELEPYERDLYFPRLAGKIKVAWNRFKFYLGVSNLATGKAEINQELYNDRASYVVLHEASHLTEIKGYNESYITNLTNLLFEPDYEDK